MTGVVDLQKSLWGLYGTPYDISQVLWDLACSAVGSEGGFVGEDGSPVGIWVVNSGEDLSWSSEPRVEILRDAVVDRQWLGEYALCRHVELRSRS